MEISFRVRNLQEKKEKGKKSEEKNLRKGFRMNWLQLAQGFDKGLQQIEFASPWVLRETVSSVYLGFSR